MIFEKPFGHDLDSARTLNREITHYLKEKQIYQRIRDVRQGPDGLIYVLTDASAGVIYRLSPP